MSRRDVLLDAGPLVAAFNVRDQWHVASVALFPELVQRCVTSEAVVTEASHLVLRATGNAHAPLDFLLRAGVPIVALENAGHRRARRLMERYRDTPMDYADATLVVLAEALNINSIFTVDRRGFSTYAPPRGASYIVLPEV